MSNGFVLLAINNDTTDYVALADTLRRSIHAVMPDAKVSLLTNSDVTDHHYDHVVRINDIDETQWKLSNDWQVYEHSPYERTIKLEVDMYIPRRIDHWWSILEDRDLNLCTTIRDYRNEISHNTFYRGAILGNKLPDTYNAITYFRKSTLAEQFYTYVRDIFENTDDYAELLQVNREERVTTDTAYALAAATVGIEDVVLPQFTDFSMIHMKKMINYTKFDDWYNQLTYEVLPHTLRIATHTQLYPFHYHTKEFAKIIDEELGND